MNYWKISENTGQNGRKAIPSTIRESFPENRGKNGGRQSLRNFRTNPLRRSIFWMWEPARAFFAIILAEAGIQVTAVDYTEEMLKEAKANAGELSEKIHFQQMDAQNLEFPDGTFDVVITRNVTWNLEHPVRAYQEWYRVLKKDGVLLNFDANWYRYLCDEELRKGYEEDRKKTKEKQVEDYYEGTDIAEMERIAAAVPLTEILRPAWDLHVMEEIGFQDCRSDETVNERILSRADQINGESTPMFLVTGRK